MKIAILTEDNSNLIYENKRLIEEAKNLGYECKAISMKDIVIEVGDKNEDGIFFSGENIVDYDVVILRSLFSTAKRAAAIVKFLRHKNVKVLDNNLEKVVYSIDKVRDSILFQISNLPIPKTINTSSEEDFLEACEDIGFPLIIKHSGSGKGAGVYKIEDEAELDDFIEKIKEENKKFRTYLIQEYIKYTKDLRILIIGGQYIGAMQRIPKENEFRANFSRGGTVKNIEIDEETKNLAIKAAEVTQAYNGGVDILLTDDNQKFVLEVNRTPGFEGFEKATGKNIAKIIIEEALK